MQGGQGRVYLMQVGLRKFTIEAVGIYIFETLGKLLNQTLSHTARSGLFVRSKKREMQKAFPKHAKAFPKHGKAFPQVGTQRAVVRNAQT